MTTDVNTEIIDISVMLNNCIIPPCFLLLNIQLNPIKLLQRMNQAKVQFKNLAEQAREIHSRQQVSETRTKYKILFVGMFAGTHLLVCIL